MGGSFYCSYERSNNINEIDRLGGPIDGSNTKDRTFVLLHAMQAAIGNTGPLLLGCIAPGFKFNTYQKDQFGNPRGTGPDLGYVGTNGKYVSPSKQESQQAVNKLVGTLFNTGKNPMFKMEIKALGGVNKPIESNFYSFSIDTEIRKIEQKTGEKYTYIDGGGTNAPIVNNNIFVPTL